MYFVNYVVIIGEIIIYFAFLIFRQSLYSLIVRVLSGHLKTGQWWSCQNRPTDEARDSVVLPLCLLIRQVHFGSPTPWAAFQNVTVMEEAVEHGGDGGAVAE